jgi:hypothetical protein
MITLRETFNNRTISTHRTLLAAVRAQRKHVAAVRKANGRSTYLPYEFLDKTGAKISDEAVTEARIELDNA